MAWQRSTGHQLVVATVPSLKGRDAQEYSVGLLRHWRLGRAGANDGVLLLLAPNERQVRIEVGYGLEPVLTDARTSAIIRETIRPSLQAGDAAGALTAGAERIMQAVASGADQMAQAPPREESRPLSWWWIVLGGLGCLVLGVFLYWIFELWFAIWPIYVLMPALARRAEQRHAARMAKRRRPDPRPAPVNDGPTNNLSTVRTMAAAMRARLDKQMARTRRGRRASGGSDALEALRDRAQRSSSDDSYDGGGSSDPGFDGGGGSGGGGGGGGNY